MTTKAEKRTHQELFDFDYTLIESMCTETGAVIAAPGADYNRVWIRDCCQVAYSLLICDKTDLGKKILRGIFNILHKHNSGFHKIDQIIEHGKPSVCEGWKLIHPLYDQFGNEMYHQDGWGWCQNDALGLFLFCVAKAEEIDQDFLTVKDIKFIKHLILYLMVIRYWEADNSIWEEGLCENSPTISSCIAGLKAVKENLEIDVPDVLIRIGEKKQHQLANKHSHNHPIDAAHLQLFFPLRISKDVSIIDDIRDNLGGEYGICRYPGDTYESGEDGRPAQWPLLRLWEGLARLSVGQTEQALSCLLEVDNLRTPSLEIPEAYRFHQDNGTGHFVPCLHTPLTWAHAFSMALRYQLDLAK